MTRLACALALVVGLSIAGPSRAAPASPARAPVTRRDVAVELVLPFRLEAVHRVAIASGAAGTIERVLVDVGAAVKRGQELVRVVGPSSKPVAALRAPFDGVVAGHPVSIGHVVAAATPPLVEIVALDPLRGVAAARELDSAKLRPGQPAELTVLAYPSARFAATVQVLFPEIDPTLQARRFEVAVANPDHRLLPGMSGTLRLRLAERRGVLTVPHGAIQRRGEQSYVTCVVGDRAQAKPVTTGLEDAQGVEITGGLDETDVVLIGER